MIADCLPNSENANSEDLNESDLLGDDTGPSSSQRGNPLSLNDIKWKPCDVRRGEKFNLL